MIGRRTQKFSLGVLWDPRAGVHRHSQPIPRKTASFQCLATHGATRPGTHLPWRRVRPSTPPGRAPVRRPKSGDISSGG